MKTVERSMRSVSVRSKPSSREAEFLGDVKAALANFDNRTVASEMANWGGWWRNRFRENPDKARRVLAEMKSMIVERRVLATPGAAAHDLWSRWPD